MTAQVAVRTYKKNNNDGETTFIQQFFKRWVKKKFGAYWEEQRVIL
jgi:hypothetical protein